MTYAEAVKRAEGWMKAHARGQSLSGYPCGTDLDALAVLRRAIPVSVNRALHILDEAESEKMMREEED